MADWKTTLYGGDTRTGFGSTINPNNVAGGTTQKKITADDLYEVQRQKQIAELQAKRDKALQTLNTQQEALKPVYQEQRTQADVSSRQGAKSLAEFMANRGLTNSGASVQGEINRQGTLQSQMGNIATQEMQANKAIEQSKADIDTAYQSDVTSANLNTQAQQLQQVLAEQEKAQASDIANINRYYQDYQAEINRRSAINPNDPLIPYLQVARQEKIANQQASYSTAQANEVKNALALFDKIGYADSYISSILGIPVGTKTQDYIKTIYSINKPYYKQTSGGNKADLPTDLSANN